MKSLKKIFLILFFLDSLFLYSNNNLLKASNYLIYGNYSECKLLLNKVDYTKLNMAQKQFYSFILAKVFYYNMEFEKSLLYFKKCYLISGIYREWAIYYSILINYMTKNFREVKMIYDRYFRLVNNIKLKKSIEYINSKIFK